jgi:ribonuclease HI
MITHKREDALAWFDGAAQKEGSLCGVGGIIKTLDASIYKWTLNCGRGTNSKVELLGVWETLLLANSLSISSIHVLGDSKVIID